MKKTTNKQAPANLDDKDVIIKNQKQQILMLRKKVKDQEALLIALGH